MTEKITMEGIYRLGTWVDLWPRNVGWELRGGRVEDSEGNILYRLDKHGNRVDIDPHHPVIGSVGGVLMSWRADGRYSTETEYCDDLIEVKPEQVAYVLLDGHGDLTVYENRSDADYMQDYGGTIYRVTLNEDNEVS